MSPKQRAWLLIFLMAALCGVTIWGVAHFRSRAVSTPAALLARLPTEDGVLIYVDFQALRRIGFLDLISGASVDEEPEYKTFIAKTGFNYKQDLDSAMVCFRPNTVFFMLHGRFDWKTLRNYVTDQGGTCRNAMCRITGSAINRRISFFPLKPDLMALAVSLDEWAATQLQEPVKRPRKLDIPSQPVWLSVPSSTLHNFDQLPDGTRAFVNVMKDSERITLSAGPSGGGEAQRFEAKIEVVCNTAQDADALVRQLERLTALLREMIARENQTPSPRDLSGVLTAGAFHREDRRVFGSWPVERVFLEALAGRPL